MSWQAQTAVNHHSKQTNLGLFRLLMYLAENAKPDGLIDPAPSQETLAAFFSCTDRTIRNWINALIDSGELVRTRRGRGDGNPSAYQINLPMPKVTGNYEEEKPGNLSGNHEESIRKLENRLESLEEKISLILPVIERLQEIEEKLTGITGNVNRKGHSLKSADDPSYDPNNIYIEPDEEPITALKTAIACVAREPLWGKTEEAYGEFAYMLHGWEQTPEQVKGFAKWWAINKPPEYVGKPALTSVINRYQDYMSGITANKTNGNLGALTGV